MGKGEEMRNETGDGQEAVRQYLKFVTVRRAAVLLGISEAELRRISHESGYGRTEVADGQEDTFFTYEELRQICVMAVQTVH
jgi:hypothetical protein